MKMRLMGQRRRNALLQSWGRFRRFGTWLTRRQDASRLPMQRRSTLGSVPRSSATSKCFTLACSLAGSPMSIGSIRSGKRRRTALA